MENTWKQAQERERARRRQEDEEYAKSEKEAEELRKNNSKEDSKKSNTSNFNEVPVNRVNRSSRHNSSRARRQCPFYTQGLGGQEQTKCPFLQVCTFLSHTNVQETSAQLHTILTMRP